MKRRREVLGLRELTKTSITSSEQLEGTLTGAFPSSFHNNHPLHTFLAVPEMLEPINGTSPIELLNNSQIPLKQHRILPMKG